MGLGAAVGSLVGGVASIPTTGVGALAGIGVGAVHGPWFGGKKKEELADEEKGDATLEKSDTTG